MTEVTVYTSFIFYITKILIHKYFDLSGVLGTKKLLSLELYFSTNSVQIFHH